MSKEGYLDTAREPCHLCGNEFDRDELIPTESGVYCEVCYEDIRSEAEEG